MSCIPNSTALSPAFNGSSRITPALPSTKYMKSKLVSSEIRVRALWVSTKLRRVVHGLVKFMG